MSDTKRFKVNCFMCGLKELAQDEYMRQLSNADTYWHCPTCGKTASWVGIDYKCQNCGHWNHDESEVCVQCDMCMCCQGNGAPELVEYHGECPICGAYPKAEQRENNDD